MRTSKQLMSALLTLLTLVLVSGAALAADPGLPYPATSEVSDQKAGSILIYNYYNSAVSQENGADTRINITNTSSTSPAYVHLFFLDGITCSVADSFICLTANQTASFLLSDQDPGVKGYIVAVAVDGVLGCPVKFNFLIGDEYFRTANNFEANLGAEAIAAIAATPSACDESSTTADLVFDGTAYNRVPRALALSNIPSPADGDDTLVIVNRISGSLLTSADPIGDLFGWLFDDAENAFSFTVKGGCQYEAVWAGNTPRTTPRIAAIIPSDRSGWAKVWTAAADRGILGAMIVRRDNGNNGFDGGHNLHKLTLSATNTYTIPVFPPNC